MNPSTFHISKKQKRRRLSNRVAATAGGDCKFSNLNLNFQSSRRGSYIALNSSSLALIGRLEVARKSEQLRDEPKEVKIKKKVSFNLNVQTYEPISRSYDFFESELEEEVVNKVAAKGRPFASAYKRASTALTSSGGLFTSNYRYQNVRGSYESYEEEEYVADEDSDFDDDDDYYGDDDYCSEGDSSETDDPRMSQEGFPMKSFSSSINGESELNVGNGIPYAHSVLSPIENLSRWKAAKAKVVAPKQQKENVPSFQVPKFVYSRSSYNQSKPLLQQMPVHAILSSWIRAK